MFSPSEEIKNKLDIVEVIGQYVKLQKVGANYKALCPFHKEKTPSFFVSPSRQIWHCFGACNEGGDIFKFIMKIENIEFKEALKILAQKAGVKLIYENPQLRSQKQKLLDINKAASDFFEQNLWKNKEVLGYLHQRGLKDETIKEFHLGWALDEWRSLSNFLIQKGFRPEDIVASGLAIFKKEPTEINHKIQNTKYRIQNTDIYDRFRSRIMFPLEDVLGQIVGFTGRIFQGKNQLKTIKDIEKIGKYINSPQTLIFDKGKILYGLSKSKDYLRKEKKTLLVEGQMDFLSTWQAGIKNIIATSGIALTPYHLKILKRYNNTLILGFDMDEAGQIASERTIELALKKEFDIKILCLPEGKDLADYLIDKQDKESKKDIKNLITQAKPIMDFYFERAKKVGDNNTIEGKKIIASYFLPKIRKLNNALDKSFWLNKISRFINIPEEALKDELNKITEGKKEIIDKNENLYQFSSYQSQSRIDGIAERVISFLIKVPSLKNKALDYKEYIPKNYKKIFDIIVNTNSEKDLEKEFLAKMNLPEDLISQIDQLALRADYEMEMLEKFKISFKDAFQKELQELKKEAIKKMMNEMEKEIEKAEKNNDKKKLENLMNKFGDLSKKLIN